MSMFESTEFPCPKCATPVEFGVVASVNADRRPDLRDALLDNSFQRGTCEKCSHSFRIEPQMTYLDVGRKQWILVQPAGELVNWIVLEQTALATFDRAYGSKAVKSAREIGKGLQVRVTFGWAAFREKLLCKEHGLDDAVLELLKIALVRDMEECPLGNDVELRLDKVEGDQLVLRWLKAAEERPVEELRVPRGLYHQIAADVDGWAELRQQLTAGPFVDLYRLLIEANLEP
jgi:hypothetical protein